MKRLKIGEVGVRVCKGCGAEAKGKLVREPGCKKPKFKTEGGRTWMGNECNTCRNKYMREHTLGGKDEVIELVQAPIYKCRTCNTSTHNRYNCSYCWSYVDTGGLDEVYGATL